MTYYLFRAAGSYYLYPSAAGFTIFFKSTESNPWCRAVNLTETDHEHFEDLCWKWEANPFEVIKLSPERVREMTFVDLL